MQNGRISYVRQNRLAESKKIVTIGRILQGDAHIYHDNDNGGIRRGLGVSFSFHTLWTHNTGSTMRNNVKREKGRLLFGFIQPILMLHEVYIVKKKISLPFFTGTMS